MSILQEYETIKNKIGEEKFAHIEIFLEQHPNYFLSDVYYKESVWNEFEKWEKQKGGIVMTWEEMKIKYPEDRDEMSDEKHQEFVKDCFNCYEQEGFSDKYWTPFEQYEEYKNYKFKVIRRATEDDGIFIEHLPMWLIELSNNKQIFAYPEEIIPSEMKFNGCPYFDN